MKRPLLAVLACLLVSACGGKDNPTAPSTPTTPSVTRIIELGGSLAFGSVPVGEERSLNFSIRNGGNANLSITGMTSPGAGTVFSANWTSGVLAPGAVQIVTVRFAPTASQSYGGTLTVNGDQTSGTNTIPITGVGARPPFSRSGVGDSVFDMPTDVSRVRIVGTYPGSSSNFIVKIGGRLIVNVIIGTSSFADARSYDGVVLTGGGGVVSITNSTGVSWTFVEQ